METEKQALVEEVGVTPKDVQELIPLIQAGPIGILLVGILLFMKFRKDLFRDESLFDKRVRLVEEQVSKIEQLEKSVVDISYKLDFLVEIMKDDKDKEGL
jgi:hypothetical protein